jgi:hypothetical protein
MRDELLLLTGGPPRFPPPIGVPVAVYVDIVSTVREVEVETADDDAAGAELLDLTPPSETDPVDVGLLVKLGRFSVLDVSIWPPDPDIDACAELDATPE